MISPPVRRFTLVDAMILIAALGVGFAGVKAESANHYHQSSLFVILDNQRPEYNLILTGGTNAMPPWQTLAHQVVRVVDQAVPVVAALSVGWLVIRLRRPHPSLRRLNRQPGLIAGWAVAAALGLNALLGLTQVLVAACGQSLMKDPKFYANVGFLACQTWQPSMIGMAVLAAWLVLKVSGRWRCEPGWIDATGVGLAGIWVGLVMNDWVLGRLQ